MVKAKAASMNTSSTIQSSFMFPEKSLFKSLFKQFYDEFEQ